MQNKTQNTKDPWAYRITDGSRKSGIPDMVLRRLIKEGKLESVKIGGRIYIPSEALRRLVEQGENDNGVH